MTEADTGEPIVTAPFFTVNVTLPAFTVFVLVTVALNVTF